jgi:hypothetical protein
MRGERSAHMKWRQERKHTRPVKKLLGWVPDLLQSFSFQDEMAIDFWPHLLFVGLSSKPLGRMHGRIMPGPADPEGDRAKTRSRLENFSQIRNGFSYFLIVTSTLF